MWCECKKIAVWVCFCSAEHMLCTCFLVNCSDDTRYTGICFGAGGVMYQTNECFCTQSLNLISTLCVCSKLLFGRVVLRENNLLLSWQTQKLDWYAVCANTEVNTGLFNSSHIVLWKAAFIYLTRQLWVTTWNDCDLPHRQSQAPAKELQRWVKSAPHLRALLSQNYPHCKEAKGSIIDLIGLSLTAQPIKPISG